MNSFEKIHSNVEDLAEVLSLKAYAKFRINQTVEAEEMLLSF